MTLTRFRWTFNFTRLQGLWRWLSLLDISIALEHWWLEGTPGRKLCLLSKYERCCVEVDAAELQRFTWLQWEVEHHSKSLTFDGLNSGNVQQVPETPFLTWPTPYSKGPKCSHQPLNGVSAQTMAINLRRGIQWRFFARSCRLRHASGEEETATNDRWIE